jgi:hypothetical protein
VEDISGKGRLLSYNHPVSVTSTIWKIMKKQIFKHLLDHKKKTNIYPNVNQVVKQITLHRVILLRQIS